MTQSLRLLRQAVRDEARIPPLLAVGVSRLPDLHVLDQTAFYQVDVLDHALRNDIPFQVADHLMNFNDRAPHLIGVESDRFDVRINRRPLARPVITDVLAAIHTPAFPTIRPIDIRAHGGQDSVNVSGIERAVDVSEQIVVCRHRASLLIYFEGFTDFNLSTVRIKYNSEMSPLCY